MSEFVLTLVQMDCLSGEPERNFERAEEFIEDAAGRGSDLVVLPELWHSSIDLENAGSYASPLAAEAGDGGWFGRFASLARDNHVWLTGSMLESQDGQFYNTMVLYSPEGKLAASYRKMHLFRLMNEDQYLAPGESGTMHELPWGCAGLAICYDLRFPELFRRYALEGARLVILPAAWPHPRRMHWRTLLRSRAIENQWFVAACNRVGTAEDVSFFGASAVVDPWGETLIEGGETEALLTVRIDLETVEATRAKIPIFADRRPELY